MWRPSFLFFGKDTRHTEIYTLSLHDALPISADEGRHELVANTERVEKPPHLGEVLPAGIAERLPDRTSPRCGGLDRKSTRLNSSHANISYAVFCLKKKNKKTTDTQLASNHNK